MTHSEFVTAALVFIVTSLVTFGSWIVRKISTHDTALAVLVEQVNPPNGKSLRELLFDIKVEAARNAGHQT